MRLDIAAIDKMLRQNKISIAFFTTQIGRQYVTEYPDNPYLRQLLTGGEKLIPCTLPKYSFDNMYGPTECSVITTVFNIEKPYDNIPIGEGLGNTDLYIIDAFGRTMPAGVPGELCISGALVARGYLNRGDLTTQKFIANPFNSAAGYEKMYKTGDICRFLNNGLVEFIGRRDFQVKIRSFRVELSEIETKIREYTGIKAAVVIARDGADGTKQILAYIVADVSINIPSLNEFIAQDLPYYTVPAATMQIKEIPLNPNGKVDKKKLPEPTFAIREKKFRRADFDVIGDRNQFDCFFDTRARRF